jgi:hypothetical protein
MEAINLICSAPGSSSVPAQRHLSMRNLVVGASAKSLRACPLDLFAYIPVPLEIRIAPGPA